MSRQEKAQISLYARCIEAVHNFEPSQENADACKVSGHLVNTVFFEGDGYTANERAARQFVRDYAINELARGLRLKSRDHALPSRGTLRTLSTLSTSQEAATRQSQNE